MKEVHVKKIEDFSNFVEGLEVNVYYRFPANFRYKWLKISMRNSYVSGEAYYSWIMEYNYKVSGTVGYIFPMSGKNKTKQFKTEKGVKTSFSKRYFDYFQINFNHESN